MRQSKAVAGFIKCLCFVETTTTTSTAAPVVPGKKLDWNQSAIIHCLL